MEQFAPRLRSYLIAWVILLAGVAGSVPAAVAQGPSYRIGPDDILAISVWDQKDLDQVVFVRPDGKVSLPLVGETDAGGLTVEQLSQRLTSLYSKTVRGAQVTVSVREIRSRPVFFLGGVARPGPMQLTQELTVLQALAAAGGPLATADLESGVSRSTSRSCSSAARRGRTSSSSRATRSSCRARMPSTCRGRSRPPAR
jgi:polysaccharide biosynthesis/export protein